MQPLKLNSLSRLIDVKNRKAKAGMPPGTLIFVGDQLTEKSEIDLISYDGSGIEEYKSENSTDIIGKLAPQKVNWINIDGLHNLKLIEEIGQHFDLHPLLVEDVLNSEHRPKFEYYEHQLFFTLKTLYNLTQ